jgi:VanZ family protein
MAKLLRKKIALLSIFVYWPVLFVLTHMPRPEILRELLKKDKQLHFMAYFILIFLCWGAIFPYKKVNWRKISAWLILAGVAGYGMIDEWSQHYMGRTMDMGDFLANLSGAVTSMVVLSIIPFIPATLVLSAMTIFILTNCLRADIMEIIPITNMAFHLISYSAFTALWLYTMYQRSLKTEAVYTTCHWLLWGIAVPIWLLAGVKMASYVLNRVFHMEDVITSLVAITLTLGIWLSIALWKFHVRISPMRPEKNASPCPVAQSSVGL